jgi:hypothetical protein
MLTYKHNHNGGGFAAAESHYAPRRYGGRTSNLKGR